MPSVTPFLFKFQTIHFLELLRHVYHPKSFGLRVGSTVVADLVGIPVDFSVNRF